MYTEIYTQFTWKLFLKIILINLFLPQLPHVKKGNIIIPILDMDFWDLN